MQQKKIIDKNLVRNHTIKPFHSYSQVLLLRETTPTANHPIHTFQHFKKTCNKNFQILMF